jgi:spermidine/putrescine transport system substrate-binding protein
MTQRPAFGEAGDNELLRHGKLSRRRFLAASGALLATTSPLLAACGGRRTASSGGGAGASKNLGNRLELVTWPHYHNPQNFKDFEKQTGVKVNVTVLGSNEEMLAKLKVGGTGWDVFVPTNYTIATYAKLGLIEPLDLSRIPNYDASQYETRFLDASKNPDDPNTTYVIPKNWGTTGYAVRSKYIKDEMTTWKQFWDGAMGKYSGKVTIHDYQLTSIGNALLYFGHDFNSIDPKELADAERLLKQVKPHLFAVSSDYQPALRSGDAWLSMCWTGDGVQVNRDHPDMHYVLGREGGEIWEDNWGIVKDAPHKDAAYAFVNFMVDPKVGAKETEYHGYAQVDQRATALVPQKIRKNPIVYPAKELLKPLSFGANQTMTDPTRAELWARVKSS